MPAKKKDPAGPEEGGQDQNVSAFDRVPMALFRASTGGFLNGNREVAITCQSLLDRVAGQL